MKIFYSFFLCLFSLSSYTQVDKLHIGNEADVESAILQIDATDRGFLIPRLNAVEREAIAGERVGLLVYDFGNFNLWYHTGTDWQKLLRSNEVQINKISDTDQNTSIEVKEDAGLNDQVLFEVNGTEELMLKLNMLNMYAGNDLLLGTSMNGAGSKFFIDSDKGSLRAGQVTGNQWDEANIGNASFAAGLNNLAAGTGSASWGEGNSAMGNNSVAFGKNNIASGAQATVFGFNNQAIGLNATCWGGNNIASGTNATTWGALTDATASSSTAWGVGAQATGVDATSFGFTTAASGLSSTAWGEVISAKGNYSTAFGYFCGAESYAETAMGTYHTIYTPNSLSQPQDEDRVLIIGNGTSHTQRSNAFEILKKGETSIGGNYNSIVDNAQTAKLKFISEITIGGNFQTEGFEFVYDGTPDVFHLTRKNLGASPFNITSWTKDGKIGVGRFPTNQKLEVNGAASKNIAGNWLANSDKRLKKNIIPISNDWALEKVLTMRGVFYHWDDQRTGFDRPEGRQIGFIAQELAEQFPAKVIEDKQGFLMAAYGSYDPVFVQAFKEQELQIESLVDKSIVLNEIISEIKLEQLSQLKLTEEVKVSIQEIEKILKQ